MKAWFCLPALLLLGMAPDGGGNCDFDASQSYLGDMVNAPLDGHTTNISFSQDGKAFFTSKAAIKWDVQHIYEYRCSPTGWQLAEALPFSNGPYVDFEPHLTADGRAMLFTSSRPYKDRPVKKGEVDLHIWTAHRTASGWSEANPISSAINDFGKVSGPSATATGDLYFTRTEAGPVYRLYWSRSIGGALQPPRRVEIPGVDEAYDATVSRGGGFLVFIAPIASGAKEKAVFIARRQGARWGAPAMLAGHIPGTSQYATGLSFDEKHVFFSSRAPDGRKVLHLYRLPIASEDPAATAGS